MPLTLTTDELGDLWRPIPDEDKVWFKQQIDLAIARLRLRVKGLDARVDADTDLMTVARGIVVEMVKRAAPARTETDDAAPEVTQHLQVAGGFTDQKIFQRPRGAMYVRDDEVALLLPARRTGARTINTPGRRW